MGKFESLREQEKERMRGREKKIDTKSRKTYFLTYFRNIKNSRSIYLTDIFTRSLEHILNFWNIIWECSIVTHSLTREIASFKERLNQIDYNVYFERNMDSLKLIQFASQRIWGVKWQQRKENEAFFAFSMLFP